MYSKKPSRPPTSAPEKSPRDVKPGHTTAITAKNTPTGTVTEEERPSTPSVMFTAFTVPTMTKAANTRYTTQGSTIWVWKKGIYRLGVSIPSYRIRVRNAMAAASCSRNFCPAVRPVLLCFFTFS